ncbi:hypothetical protein Q5752_000133 [Cryptotrichosporon argae]
MASPSRASSPTLDPTELGAALRDMVTRPRLSVEEASAALEEFAWTCLIGGVRVREYCRIVSEIVQVASLKGILGLALIHPTTRLVLPFTTLPTNAYVFSAPLPSPLLPPAPLAITRKHLIDALARLSRETGVADGSAPKAEERVVEVCLEYAGKRWRCAGDDDIVEGIGRKLAEVEFEVQLQGDPLTVRTVIAPTIQRLRFILGLCSASQLVTRLNNMVAWTRAPYDPAQIAQAWIERRLNAGVDPARAGHDLFVAAGRCHAQDHRADILGVLAEFGVLDRRGPADAPPPDLMPASPRKRTMPKLGGSITRKTMSAGPRRWFTHRASSSVSSRLQVLGFPGDRRPSLPSISTPTLSMPPSESVPLMRQSAAYLPLSGPRSPVESTSTHGSGPGSNPRASSSTAGLDSSAPPQLMSSLMTFTEPEDVRLILLDYLLGMRFRIATVPDSTWHLGTGRACAASVLDSVEDKLVGRKDVMGIKTVLDDLRTKFRIAVYIPSPTIERKSSQRTQRTKVSRTSHRWVRSPSRGTEAGTDEPFDLEAYLDECGHMDELPAIVEAQAHEHQVDPPASVSSIYSSRVNSVDPTHASSDRQHPLSETKRYSTGAASLLSMSSRTNGAYRRSSMMSSYTIREATRAYPLSLRAKHFRFSTSSTVSLEDLDSESDGQPERSPYDSRLAKSTNDLLHDTYTWAPGTLRRSRQRINGFASPLSADYNGLRLPAATASSPYIPMVPSPINLTPPPSPGGDVAAVQLPIVDRPDTPPSDVSDVSSSPDFVPVVLPDSRHTPTPPHGTGTPFRFRLTPDSGSPTSSQPGLTPRPSRSQRNLHRQIAIVNGEQWSPTSSPAASPHIVIDHGMPDSEYTVPSPRPAQTSLRLILQLFADVDGELRLRQDLDQEELDRILLSVVRNERERLEGRGQVWDAEARRRVAWLVEEVGQEIGDTLHTSVVERILRRLSNPSKHRHVPPPLRLTHHASHASFLSTPPSVSSRLAYSSHGSCEPVFESPPATPRTFATSRMSAQSYSSFVLAPDSPPVSSRTFGTNSLQQQRMDDLQEPKLGWLHEVNESGTLPETPTILRRFASQDATLRQPRAPTPVRSLPYVTPPHQLAPGTPPRPPRRLFETPPLRFGRVKLDPAPRNRRTVTT